MNSAVTQYLDRYAEPEAKLIFEHIPLSQWDHVVMVPSCGEDDILEGLFESISSAARETHKHVLVILVVNSNPQSNASHQLKNEQLLYRLGISPSSPFSFLPKGFDLLVVDRSRVGRQLPLKEGVGLARKIAADIALGLWTDGRIRADFGFCTDADARISTDYFFGVLEKTSSGGFVGYRHEHLDEHPELMIYEWHLRYYEKGLRFAGSPYAFPTIGSTLVFRFSSYAEVRGFPKLEAGEDFYLMNKLFKVGQIKRLPGQVRLVPRSSDRVPFGTGRSMADNLSLLSQSKPVLTYHPHVFLTLKDYLEQLKLISSSRDMNEYCAFIQAHKLSEWSQTSGMDRSLKAAVRSRPNADDLKRTIIHAFDGFRTLKLIHHLSDTQHPKLPWSEANRLSPWGELSLDDLRQQELIPT